MKILITNKNQENTIMDLLTLGWVAVLGLFSWSIAMVVWGRNGL